MILPVGKIASGLAAVATAATPNLTSNEWLNVAVGKTLHPPAFVGTSAGIVPVLSAETAAAPGMLLFRGGASTSLVNFSRESLFLQGMATYATITALIMNAALRIWTSTSFSKEQNKIVSNVFNSATALCLMSGIFTAILFQLLTIYSKSALGMGNDAGYMAFKASTRAFRIWGFRCFLTEMVSFVLVFITRLYNSLWMDARQCDEKSTLTTTGKFIMGGSVILTATGVSLVHAVLRLASKQIF